MELEKIAIRAFLSYVFLLASIRLAGKRTVSHATPFDFVLALILGDMIDDALWSEVPFAQFVIGAGTLVLVQIVVSLVSARNPGVQRLLEGEPAMFMRAGRFLHPRLRAELVSEPEAVEMLRIAGGLECDDYDEVKSARIEMNGHASVLRHHWARPAQQGDLEQIRKMKRAAEE